MSIFKCKMCGGDLTVTQGSSVAVCEYCGAKQTISTTEDEVLSNLYNRANNLRRKCEFDKAEQIYEKIVQKDDSESEAHWGIVLCKYGIEYVEDPETFKRVPTCHRTSYEAIRSDADYQAAIDYADVSQQAIYEEEARYIDKIQKDILAIANNEKPFDVFICYKETDENGKRTVDSVIANDIYYQLTQEGFKVFYAAITLEDKLGQEYEPYIFSALNSAKVMLVVGTKPEYFNAVWVKNEWSRYLKIIKNDRKKLLIPCYRDMDAYDLPEEFSHLQAQDMIKIGFINDVTRGIKKVLASDKSGGTDPVIIQGNSETAPLLERMFMFLEDGEWNRADNFAEQILNTEPKCAEAYLGKLMSKYKVNKEADLVNCIVNFEHDHDYQRVIRFGNAELVNKMNSCIEKIRLRVAELNNENIYQQAKKTASENTTESLSKAIELLNTISEYKDTKEIIEKFSEQIKSIEEKRKKALKITVKDLIAQKEELLEQIQYSTHSTALIIKSQIRLIDEQLKECEKNGFIYLEDEDFEDDVYVDLICPYCDGEMSYPNSVISGNTTVMCPHCEKEVEI